MKYKYKPKKFTNPHRLAIRRANEVLNEYWNAGFVLTLRQLYYQFVARGWIKNEQKSYKWLGNLVGDARLAGYIDWEMIEDRTRNLQSLQHFDGADDALTKLASWYHVDMWANQEFRPEVWIEKDALTGVISGVCQENDIPYFSCRGYTSLSEMWRASLRLSQWTRDGQSPYIIHFGDHDPSGMDMSRDICERIQGTFMADCEFHRLALNMDQIREYNPPPNPAKVTDSRYKAYVTKFGNESWELDALDPPKFRSLIEDQLKRIRDDIQWEKDQSEKKRVKDSLVEVANDWEKIGEQRKRVEQLEKELKKTKSEIVRLNKKINKDKEK